MSRLPSLITSLEFRWCADSSLRIAVNSSSASSSRLASLEKRRRIGGRLAFDSSPTRPALRGSATPTCDIDIMPATGAVNLARLSAALTELGARVRVDGIPDELPFAHDATSLAQMTTLNLVTRFGDLDVAFDPSRIADYSQWEMKRTGCIFPSCEHSSSVSIADRVGIP